MENTSAKATSIPVELRTFLWLSGLMWMLSLAYVALRLHFGSGPSHGLPALVYSAPFLDLKAAIGKLEMVHTQEFFSVDYRWIYPAPTVFLYKFLLQFSYNGGHKGLHAAAMYLGCVLAGLAVLLIGMVSALQKRGLSLASALILEGSALLLSWPIFFAVRQGNVEAILWVGAALGIWAWYRQLWWTAALIIGVVAGFKIYPILLLGLFLRPRKYLQIVVSLLVFLGFTLVGLAYIGPTVTIAYRNVAMGIKSFTELGFWPAAVDRDYLTYEHSLVSLIRVLTTSHPEYMVTLSHLFMPLAAILMTVLFFTVVWKMPRLNQLFVITLAIVLLPPKSYDYTLQMLYIPWAWLAMLSVSATRRGVKIPGLMPVMVCLALICSPEFFLKFQGFYSFGQFKAICLLALLWMVVRYPFQEKRYLVTDLVTP